MIWNVLEYLESSALAHPYKICFADEGERTTFSEVRDNARAIASCLLEATGGARNQPVAVSIDRSIAPLVAFLGVVYSGNFYVPVDLQLPRSRLENMFNTLQPGVLLTSGKDRETLEGLSFNGRVITFDEARQHPIAEGSLAGVRRQAIDTDPLYAIFTSGSTGVPKAVLVSHRSVIDLIEHFADIFGFSPDNVFGNQAPFDFDVSVKDIYSTLKNAASLQVIPRRLFSFPGELFKYLNARNINTAIWATSALRIVHNLHALEGELPHSLKQILFSGEVMPNKVLNYWRSHLPDVQYVNLYGPTEITCNCSYYIVDRDFNDQDALPIGFPFPNTDILVLNDKDQLVTGDEIGEICVRGSSLALGYYNSPTETAKAFCQNLLNPHYPERIYRTGDLGRYNQRGELMFLSRKDSQIKHMGHRIELGEIEVAVNALPFLDAACCLYSPEEEKIVLFYQADAPCEREILLGLRQSLPKYILPNKLVWYERLPMNKNAKIDRVRLMEEYERGKSS